MEFFVAVGIFAAAASVALIAYQLMRGAKVHRERPR